MPTFDGSTTTRTSVSLEGDDFSPGMGSLSGSGNTEDMLVHGTLNQKVDSNVTRLFMSNETINTLGSQNETILGSRTLTITGSETETVVGGRTTTIVGMLTETLVAGQMTTCVGPFNRTDVAPVTWLCPSSSQINSGDLFEVKIFKGGAYAIRNTNVGIDTSLRGTNLQAGIHAMNLTQFETKLGTVECWNCITHNKVGGLTNFLDGLRNHLAGTVSAARAIEAKAGPEVSPPLELGAPPFD